jgi:PAT family acetyl-CoA transporter-like MFS transporter 1
MLAATQDVAVDGWALTMLRPANLGLASCANTLGQTLGWLLGYSAFTWLESQGLLSLSQFLTGWGVAFLVTTLSLAALKSEAPPGNEAAELGLLDTYRVLWRLLRHPLMLPTVLLLLTYKIGFSGAEAAASLKLVEVGVPRATVAALALPMVPVKVVLTLLLCRWLAGRRALSLWLAATPPRLLLCLGLVGLVYWAAALRLTDTPAPDLPPLFHAALIGVYSLHLTAKYVMEVAIMAFFARVSDPAVGGTCMTFLNTMNNLGTMWPRSLALWLLEALSARACLSPTGGPALPLYNATGVLGNLCDGGAEAEACEVAGGRCGTVEEGYYTLGPAAAGLGLLLLLAWGGRTARQLEREPRDGWRVVGRGKGARAAWSYFYCC